MYLVFSAEYLAKKSPGAETHKNAQERTKTRHLAQMHTIPPFIIPPRLIILDECFRGRHRGGRHVTSFLRFSGHFFHAAK